ncbi:MAG TPA: hypothetical protein VG408_03825 [Actinomycetota bacterium]|nr:hypothetical protein [Actinomycetota bacterium]
MKRGMGGGSYRGPLGLRRQRRTIRFVQVLLIGVGFGLAGLALVSLGEVRDRPDPLTLAVEGSIAQPIVLGLLALFSWFAAWLLADGLGSVRIPTPARLDELAGRAEDAAIARAEEAAVTDET